MQGEDWERLFRIPDDQRYQMRARVAYISRRDFEEARQYAYEIQGEEMRTALLDEIDQAEAEHEARLERRKRPGARAQAPQSRKKGKGTVQVTAEQARTWWR